MNKSDLMLYIDDSDKLNENTLPQLQHLVQEYPYFQTARLLLAKNRYMLDRTDFEKHLQKTATLCADRKRFFYLINNAKYARFFPKKEQSYNGDRTQMLLDSFLDNFSGEGKEEETPRIETNIVSIDYLAYLQSSEHKDNTETTASLSQTDLKHQSLIDSFLEKAAANEIALTPSKHEPANFQSSTEESDGDGTLTETLSKIYIKQKKYEQALAIIRQLSLNFPKKSIYFADQIRFLELLILNEKNKKE